MCVGWMWCGVCAVMFGGPQYQCNVFIKVASSPGPAPHIMFLRQKKRNLLKGPEV